MIKYLILGGVLATFGVSMLEAITDLIVTFIELLKALISVQIMKCNAKITEPENTRAIGFAIREECDDED
jgi:hypothetical protein